MDELARIDPDRFLASHLASVRRGIDLSIARMVERYHAEVPEFLRQAWEAGQELNELEFQAATGEGTPGTGGIAPLSLETLEVLQNYSADLITNLGGVARQRINAVISQAALGGISPFEAIQRIAGTIPDRSIFPTLEARAEAILRTEVNRVFSVAGQARLSQMAERFPGQLQKRWLTAGDARVRPAHAAAGGQVVGADEPFTVGGFKAMFPRDPALPASQSVMCRCHSIPVIPELEQEPTPPTEDLPPLEEEAARGPKASLEDEFLGGQDMPDARTAASVTRSAYQRFNIPVERVSFAGLDGPTATRFGRAYLEMARRYPVVAGRIKVLETSRARSFYADAWSGGLTRRGTIVPPKIRMSTHYGRDSSGFLNQLARDVVQGWHPPGGSTIESVVYHEFGHHVYWTAFERSGGTALLREMRGVFFRHGLATSEGAAAGVTASRAGKLVSNYARKNWDEFFAEVWMEYQTMGKRARPFVRDVGAVLENYL